MAGGAWRGTQGGEKGGGTLLGSAHGREGGGASLAVNRGFAQRIGRSVDVGYVVKG